MCWSCARGEIEDAGLTQIVVTDEMVRVARLIEDFYQLPGCSVGGPLHIATDDNNVTDHDLDFCRGALLGTDREAASWHDEFKSIERDALGIQILDALAKMSLPERAVTCVMRHGDRYVPPGQTREFTYPKIVTLEEFC